MKSRRDKELMTPPAAGRRPGGRTMDVSNRISTAVMEILMTHGYGALNFQDVAEQADVSRTTLYRRWPTKAELVLDVMSVALAERIEIPDTGSFIGDITTSFRQMGTALKSPFGVAALSASLEMMRAAEGDEPRQELWIRRFADMWPLVERARARQELPEDLDVEAMIAALAGAMYYRVLIMARPIDDPWIKRIIATVIPAPKLKPPARAKASVRGEKRKKP